VVGGTNYQLPATNNQMLLTESMYLPPIGIVALAAQSGAWQWEAHEHYQKISFRNRCIVVGADGPINLTIPLQAGKHEKQAIKDVRIVSDQPWQRTHWRTIVSCYKPAPFADELLVLLEPLYLQQFEFLWDWNFRLIQTLSPWLPTATPSFSGNWEPKLNLPDTIFDARSLKPKTLLAADIALKPYIGFYGESGSDPTISVLDRLMFMGPWPK
jgi:WbqC-like protein family